MTPAATLGVTGLGYGRPAFLRSHWNCTSGSGNRVNLETGNLTLGSGILIHSQNGSIGGQNFIGGPATLTNNGQISADVSGGTIFLGVNGLTTNQGTLSAQNGGILQLNSNVTNAGSGHIDAGTGSAVVQNAVTVSDGTINTTGTGAFDPTNSSNNFLNGMTLNGTIDMASGTSIERVTGGLTLQSGGTITVNNNSILAFQGDQTLGGTGSIVLGASGSGNRINIEGTSTLTVGPNITIHGQNGSIGGQNFIGGTANLVNNGTINADTAGTITIGVNGSLVNNGTLRAQNGTLTIQNPLTGTGTLQVDSTGIINLANSPNSQGRLVMGTAGSTLNIGTQNLAINTDYTNAAFGSGNSFNNRAGISGAGLVVAGGDAAQAITGANVSNGNTNNATLTIGNVHVGANTFNYQIANTGTTGPSLRGAIQTNVNGANLTDTRLSGTGVTAGNYNTGGPGGNTGDLGVTFTAVSAGALVPLSGQKLNLTSNFSNIADQKLNIMLGADAAAYNLAAGSATPTPVVLANQRVGGAGSQVLTVANTAPSGSFTEVLNASFGANTGAATNNNGSITGGLGTGGIAGGANNATDMKVGVDTSSAGAKSGTVTLNYVSNGTGTSGLGNTDAGSQTINISGNVYRLAQGDTTHLLLISVTTTSAMS